MKYTDDAIQKSKAHFDSTAKDYDNSSDGKFTEHMYAPLIKELRKSKSGNLLDVGCGNGNVLAPLSDTGLELYGIDLSQAMIEEAKKRLNDSAALSTANAEELPFEDKKFDILVCNASFHHYPKPKAVLSEMNRVMRKNAILYIGETYLPGFACFLMNLFIRFSPDGDFHIYGKRELIRLLQAHGFKLVGIQKTAEHAVLYIAEKTADMRHTGAFED